MRRICFVAAACLLWWPSMAVAELKWESKHLQAHPKFTDTKATAQFRFTNVGQEPITIASIKAACGCTVATSEKRVYEPGETGHIEVAFSFGPRVGRQSKDIAVTLQGEPGPVILTMVTFIPEPLILKPMFVVWKPGEIPEPRVIELIAPTDARVLIDSVASSDPRFAVDLETLEEGKSYRIHVTPTDLSAPCISVVKIESRIGTERKTYRAFAKVQAPMDGEKLKR